MWQLNEIEISVVTKFYWNTATLISLYNVYGSFHATMAELDTQNRDIWLSKPKLFISGPLQKKTTWLRTQGSFAELQMAYTE